MKNKKLKLIALAGIVGVTALMLTGCGTNDVKTYDKEQISVNITEMTNQNTQVASSVNKVEGTNETKVTGNEVESKNETVITANKVENVNEVKTPENKVESKNETKITEDKIRELYLEKIKEIDNGADSSEKLLDYRIDKVSILSEEHKKSTLEFDEGIYYKDTDILAYVTYSVKPQDVNNNYWMAGNGKIEGDWITGKVACVCIRDGEIVSDGTGW